AVLAFLDAEATSFAASHLGTRLAPPSWAIRTYMPHLVKDSAVDARRHRVLGQSRIDSDGGHRTASRLGWIAEESSLPVADNTSVRKAKKELEQARNRILIKGDLYRDRVRSKSIQIIERSAPSTTPEALLPQEEIRQAHLLRELVGFDRFTEDNILEIAGAYERSTKSDVQERLQELLSQIDESEQALQ